MNVGQDTHELCSKVLARRAGWERLTHLKERETGRYNLQTEIKESSEHTKQTFIISD